MSNSDVALFPSKPARVVALDHGVFEHHRRADKIDAVVAKIVQPGPLVPFEHIAHSLPVSRLVNFATLALQKRAPPTTSAAHISNPSGLETVLDQEHLLDALGVFPIKTEIGRDLVEEFRFLLVKLAIGQNQINTVSKYGQAHVVRK